MPLTLTWSLGHHSPPSAGGHPLARGVLRQKELQRVGGVAGPCGLIRVSWGLRGLRSCPHQGSGMGGLRPRSLGGNLQILQQAWS